ncbi:6109_t:CDS:2 [Ambispora gerdemannii]|uniref:6109_t:CDS:1 n=1 Tax=Ambispora gerdemannii TaxID=144530 RepID=A0A9N9GNU4_9GLOM|nr:6109_t:CDS:2 [Ambispora gerdemannii]
MSVKRNNTTTACVNCRKKRTRCTGNFRCQRCIKLGLECTFVPPTKKRGPQKKGLHAIVETKKSITNDCAERFAHIRQRQQQQQTSHSIFVNSRNKNDNTKCSLRLPSFSQIENLDDSFLNKPTPPLNQQHCGDIFNNKERQHSINEPRKSAFTPYFSRPPPISSSNNNNNVTNSLNHLQNQEYSWLPKMKNSNPSTINHLEFLPSVPLYPLRNGFPQSPLSFAQNVNSQYNPFPRLYSPAPMKPQIELLS